MNNKFLNIEEAKKFASSYLGKTITSSNIAYLVNYGRVQNFGNKNNVLIKRDELENYYKNYYRQRESNWKEKLGDDIDWHLSFEQYKESDTTKHVHRLHPYKGKFIPQLVEYFLDDKTDEFKKNFYFKKGDIILDPFCGSGTTLVQANELGMHAIGIDISQFNSLISNIKVGKHDLIKLNKELKEITEALQDFVYKSNVIEFEEKLLDELNKFNNRYFPSPEFKRQVKNREIDEKEHSEKYSNKFLPIFNKLVQEFSIPLLQNKGDNFIDKWYLQTTRNEIDFMYSQINRIKDEDIRKVITIILSRTIRSCRATTHSDLATLIEPISSTYYCSKHGKICKPLFSILSWWKRYSEDTLKRLLQFNDLRTDTYQYCFTGDASTIDIEKELKDSEFEKVFREKRIKGIFTSPPYVGLINYHEQHAYAYDLFGFERRDEQEIGSLSNGRSKEARDKYIEGISSVLINCQKWLTNDFDIFIVANDKFNMYPIIAEKSGLKIVQQFKRPVLNRTEKDKSAYSESIFHMKEKEIG